MKANHNNYMSVIFNLIVVVNINKSKNESKSQLRKGAQAVGNSCGKYQ